MAHESERAWSEGLVRGPGPTAWSDSLVRQPGPTAWRDGLVRWPGAMAWRDGLARWPGAMAWSDSLAHIGSDGMVRWPGQHRRYGLVRWTGAHRIRRHGAMAWRTSDPTAWRDGHGHRTSDQGPGTRDHGTWAIRLAAHAPSASRPS